MLDLEVDELSCGVKCVFYDDKNIDLLKSLDIPNPKSHVFKIRRNHAKSAGVVSERPARNEVLKSQNVNETIQIVNELRIGGRARGGAEVFIIEGFTIPHQNLKSYALSLEEQLEYTYRGTSEDDLIFFIRRPKLEALHIGIIKKFYDKIYDGPIVVADNGHLSIYVDGEEFLMMIDINAFAIIFLVCFFPQSMTV